MNLIRENINDSVDTKYSTYQFVVFDPSNIKEMVLTLKNSGISILGATMTNDEDDLEKLRKTFSNENSFLNYYFIEFPCETRKIARTIIDCSFNNHHFSLNADFDFDTITVARNKKDNINIEPLLVEMEKSIIEAQKKNSGRLK